MLASQVSKLFAVQVGQTNVGDKQVYLAIYEGRAHRNNDGRPG